MHGLQLAVQDLQEKVLKDYRQVAGKVIYVDFLMGYNDEDDQIDVGFDPPIAVRVEPGQDKHPEQGLFHHNPPFFDPYWDVEIVDLSHPDIPKDGLRSCFMHGHSYGIKGEVEPTRFRVETKWEGFVRLWRNLTNRRRP